MGHLFITIYPLKPLLHHVEQRHFGAQANVLRVALPKCCPTGFPARKAVVVVRSSFVPFEPPLFATEPSPLTSLFAPHSSIATLHPPLSNRSCQHHSYHSPHFALHTSRLITPSSISNLYSLLVTCHLFFFTIHFSCFILHSSLLTHYSSPFTLHL